MIRQKEYLASKEENQSRAGSLDPYKKVRILRLGKDHGI